jgi:hypothetical protein
VACRLWLPFLCTACFLCTTEGQLPSTTFFNGQDCSFGHIFNDYLPSSNVTVLEYSLILESWLEAIKVAKENGIRAELIPVVLKGDETSIPSQVYKEHTPTKKPVMVYEYLQSTTHNTHLPTIGEIIDAGLNATTAQAMVFTNRDIGMYPNFYVDACRDLSQPGILALERTRVRIGFGAFRANKTEAMFHKKLANHPGADCLIVPVHVIPHCLRNNRQLVIGLPPWGGTLRT